jgi:hypothetical protein
MDTGYANASAAGSAGRNNKCMNRISGPNAGSQAIMHVAAAAVAAATAVAAADELRI